MLIKEVSWTVRRASLAEEFFVKLLFCLSICWKWSQWRWRQYDPLEYNFIFTRLLGTKWPFSWSLQCKPHIPLWSNLLSTLSPTVYPPEQTVSITIPSLVAFLTLLFIFPRRKACWIFKITCFQLAQNSSCWAYITSVCNYMSLQLHQPNAHYIFNTSLLPYFSYMFWCISRHLQGELMYSSLKTIGFYKPIVYIILVALVYSTFTIVKIFVTCYSVC